jgi:hypothetical protein
MEFEVTNLGKGPALSVYLYQKGKTGHMTRLHGRGPVGDIPAGGTRRIDGVSIRLERFDAHGLYVYARDSHGRWLATKVVLSPYGEVVTKVLPPRWERQVPADVVDHARGETTVEYFVRLLEERGRFRKLIDWWEARRQQTAKAANTVGTEFERRGTIWHARTNGLSHGENPRRYQVEFSTVAPLRGSLASDDLSRLNNNDLVAALDEALQTEATCSLGGTDE